jgi:hypothetical protein
MRRLNDFVAEHNNYYGKFHGYWDLNNASDRQDIAQEIDCQLSPENLHCDGEISAYEAHKKLIHLNNVARELLALDPTVTFYEYSA